MFWTLSKEISVPIVPISNLSEFLVAWKAPMRLSVNASFSFYRFTKPLTSNSQVRQLSFPSLRLSKCKTQLVTRSFFFCSLLNIRLFRPRLGKERDLWQFIRTDGRNRFKNVPSQTTDHSPLHPGFLYPLRKQKKEAKLFIN